MLNFVRGFLLHPVNEVHIFRYSIPTIAIECINCINFTSHPWQPELLSPVKRPGLALQGEGAYCTGYRGNKTSA